MFPFTNAPVIWTMSSVVTLLALIWVMHWSTRLLAPSSCLWWHRNWQKPTGVGLFMASSVISVRLLESVCRYPCQQWQSDGLSILGMISAFVAGMIITRPFYPSTMALRTLVKEVLLVTCLLAFATVLVLRDPSSVVPNSVVTYLWSVWLPILGVVAKRLCPRLFEADVIGTDDAQQSSRRGVSGAVDLRDQAQNTGR